MTAPRARSGSRAERVLVTGMGVICSIGDDVGSFTAALRRGDCGIGPANPAGGEPAGAPQPGAYLRGFDFSRAVAGRAALPDELHRRAHRVARRSPLGVQAAVAAALQAWEEAGLHAARPPGDRIGLVVAGNNLTGRPGHDMARRYAGNPAYVPGRFALHSQDTDHVGSLSEILGVTGEGYTVGGASASGGAGMVNGGRLIQSGAVDACLVVGALTDLSPLERQSLVNLGAMADGGRGTPPETMCRPFDAGRRGFVYGQGAACLVLESARCARRRGAAPLAELRGYALALSGNSLADPAVAGEVRAMEQAIARAGIAPGDLGYVSAHATGSPLGDDVEIRALRQVLGRCFGRPWINATKGLTGHCLCAAGVIEAVATVAQLRGGFVHPNANLTCPIAADGNFAGATAQAARISFALSNSFGFGGFNTAVVLGRPES